MAGACNVAKLMSSKLLAENGKNSLTRGLRFSSVSVTWNCDLSCYMPSIAQDTNQAKST